MNLTINIAWLFQWVCLIFSINSAGNKPARQTQITFFLKIKWISLVNTRNFWVLMATMNLFTGDLTMHAPQHPWHRRLFGLIEIVYHDSVRVYLATFFPLQKRPIWLKSCYLKKSIIFLFLQWHYTGSKIKEGWKWSATSSNSQLWPKSIPEQISQELMYQPATQHPRRIASPTDRLQASIVKCQRLMKTFENNCSFHTW